MGKKKNLPTIREVEAKKVEHIRSSKKQIAKFNIYRYPTPTKRVNSISLLKKRIDEFFNQYDLSDKTKPKGLPLPSDLAIYLGYSSYRAMAQDINSPVSPEYSAILERAVEYINSLLMRTELDIAQRAKDVRGIDNVLKRIDKQNEQTLPKSEDPKNQINIQINIEKQRKIEDFVSEQMSELFASVDSKEEDCNTSDIEFEEVQDD